MENAAQNSVSGESTREMGVPDAICFAHTTPCPASCPPMPHIVRWSSVHMEFILFRAEKKCGHGRLEQDLLLWWAHMCIC